MKTFTSILIFLIFSTNYLMAQWSSDPAVNNSIANVSGEEAIPKVKTTTDGTTYIAWFSNESGNYNVRLQKLDVFGNKMWADEGLLVSNNPAMTWLTDWDMTVGNDGYTYLIFQDIRNVNNDVFAYRISPEGEFMWGVDGVELSTGPAFDAAPKVAVTNVGNAIFAWQAEEVVIIQKINPSGEKLWGDDGIILSGSNTFSWPQLLAVGDDDMIIKYFDDSGPVWAPTRHVFANRLDTDGNFSWNEDAIISNAGGISAWTQVFPMINDGNDGFYIAWHDDRDGNNLSSTFVQHISADGQVLLGDDGTEASTQAGRHNFYPQLALPDVSDNIFVYWNEMDANQNDRGIYGQKISPTGERLWSDNGKKIIEISSTNVYPIAARPAGTDMVLFYEEYFNAMDAAVKAMRLDTDGEFVWGDEMIDLCSVQSEKVHSVVSNFIYDQWIAVWEDSRNGGKDIYAQNIQLDGTLGPVIIAGEIEVLPDTMFFEENPQILPCKILNNTNEIYTITELDDIGVFWWILDPVPILPYEIIPDDSLVFNVRFEWYTKTQTDGYEIDYMNIIAGTDTNSVVIAINENLLVNISSPAKIYDAIKIIPNPSNSNVRFEFPSLKESIGILTISNLNGKFIRRFNTDGKSPVIWDGKNNNGQRVPPGIYFYKIITGDYQINGKLIRE